MIIFLLATTDAEFILVHSDRFRSDVNDLPIVDIIGLMYVPEIDNSLDSGLGKY